MASTDVETTATSHRRGPPLLTIDREDSIETVMNAMKSFPNDADVLEQALDYISYRCTETEPERTLSSVFSFSDPSGKARAMVLSAGAAPLVIATLQSHTLLQEKAERALLDLLIKPLDGVKKIVGTMRKYPALMFVQERGCEVLSQLIGYPKDYMARSELRECGGIESLMDLFNDPDSSLSLKGFAIHALGHASSNVTNRARIREDLPPLIATWKSESCTAEIHIGVCVVLSRLAQTGAKWQAKGQESIAELGGVATLVASLRRFHEETAVAQACFALAYVCRNNRRNTRLLSETSIALTIVHLLGDYSPQCVGPVLQLMASDEGISEDIAKEGGLDALLEAARQHLDSEPDVSVVFHTLCALTRHSCLTEKMRTPEATEIGKEAFQRFPAMDPLRQFLIQIGEELPPLSDPLATREDRAVDISPSISFLTTTEDIFEKMAEFAFDATVQEQACLQLSRFSWAAGMLLEYPRGVATVRGIELLVLAMKNHPDSLNIQKLACDVLCYLVQKSGISVSIVEEGGIEVLIKSMDLHKNDTTFHELACTLLQKLLLKSKETTADQLVSVGGIQVLVNSMSRHPASISLQKCGVGSLAILANNIPTNQKLIAEAGGGQSAFNALKLHGWHAGVREAACVAVGTLVENNSQNQSYIVGLGGIGLLVSTIKECNAIPRTIEYPLRALVLLGQGGCEGGWSAAIDVFVDVLLVGSQFDLALQMSVCSVLCSLCMKSEDYRDDAVAAKAGRTILVAMERNKASAEFQECAVEALVPISESAEGWKQMWKYDGVDILISAITEHPDSEGLRREAFKVFLKLSDGRRALAKSGVIELAREANAKFPSVDIFQGFLQRQEGVEAKIEVGAEAQTVPPSQRLEDVEREA